VSRLLITGATGFIGKHLVRRALESGHEVLAATRADLAVPGARVLPVGGFEYADWQGQLRGIDAIIHLAARVHQMHDTSRDPLASFRKVNRDATLRLAKAARAQGVKRFVFLSTVKAAVDATDTDGVDDFVTPNPQTPYGISKWEAEQELLEIDGLETIILRPPLVYGEGAKGNLVSFYRLAKTGLPMPFGTIRNARSLIGVTNLVDAMVHALSIKPSENPIYFLEDARISTGELYRAIAVSLRRHPLVLPVPQALLQFAGRMMGQPDAIERLTESLAVDAVRFRETGWTPAMPMSAELENFARSLYSF
jgi:nucleoside-diphosphate-sugar epimerase